VIEVGLAPDAIARYLRATRGVDSEYLSRDVTALETFYVDVLESLYNSGLNIHHIKLYLVDSVRSDIETLHHNGCCQIIFDQGMMDIFDMLNHVFLTEFPATDPDSLPPPQFWAHALFANRFLARGQRVEASIQAAIANNYSSVNERPDSPYLQHGDLWVTVQSGYAIAHEIAHCHLDDESTTLARTIANDFENKMLPLVRRHDEENPVDLTPPHLHLARNVNADLARKFNLDLSTVLEHFGEKDWEMIPQRRARTLEEQLDVLLHDDSNVGEEILCDYWAMLFTSRIMGSSIIHPDEALVICFAAFLFQSAIRYFEAQAASFSDDYLSLETMLDETDEVNIRTQFFMFSAQIIGDMHILHDYDLGLISGDDLAVTGRQRRELLAENLNSLNKAYYKIVEPIVAQGIAGQTFLMAHAIPADDVIRKIASSSTLADVVRDCVKNY